MGLPPHSLARALALLLVREKNPKGGRKGEEVSGGGGVVAAVLPALKIGGIWVFVVDRRGQPAHQDRCVRCLSQRFETEPAAKQMDVP